MRLFPKGYQSTQGGGSETEPTVTIGIRWVALRFTHPTYVKNQGIRSQPFSKTSDEAAAVTSS